MSDERAGTAHGWTLCPRCGYAKQLSEQVERLSVMKLTKHGATEFMERTPEDDRYDERLKAAEDRLRPLLTDEFLATLILAARTIGWGVDIGEVHNFICDLHYIRDGKAKHDIQDLTPFDYNDPPASE